MLNLRSLIGIIILTILCVVVVNAQSQRPAPSTGILGSDKKSQASENKTHSKYDQRGTEQFPLVIKVTPSPNAQEEAAQAKKEKNKEATRNRRIEVTTYIVAGATAVQALALIITIIVMIRTTRKQLRAHIAAEAPVVIPQDITAHRRYEVRLNIRNVGNTPGYNVTFNTHVDILPIPLPEKFDFPLSPTPHIGTGTIFPNQAFTINGFLDKMCSAEEIIEIKNATTKGLYIYGIVSYRDTFKKIRHTEFSEHFEWLMDGTVKGNYTKKHNDAD